MTAAAAANLQQKPDSPEPQAGLAVRPSAVRAVTLRADQLFASTLNPRRAMDAGSLAELAHSIVEIFFGGAGKFPVNIGNREFTAVEQRVLRRVVAIALREFVTAWEPVQSFEPEVLRYEFNPQFANVASPSDLVIVSTFRVTIESGGGWVTVCLPYNAVEQLRDQLMSGVASDRHADDRWFGMLRVGVERVNLHAAVELLDIEISVNDLLKMRNGDVFEVELPETVTVNINNMPLFRGKWGRHRGKSAVRIESKLNGMPSLLEAVLPHDRRLV